ncbi:LysR family transcriptional regulator [Paenibacillus frigoriresistens]|uniref:LysR family transcriptional regulator n=1 Tax=Paenibacillus alginolyticus TaxID=59839 RepID=UPI001563F14C|nr:LysR family transcriptional regulator [Paenibacillus frigoriresistens]NRF92443.1 LysR family transcriptional regulator [Paenibacillus frigoriresistens]
MNTKHLSLFMQVIKKGSITQVAKETYVSQPAISMQLKRLEQEVGVPLFTVVGRDIVVTDAGFTLLEYAESMLSLEGQIYRAMEEYRLGNRGKIIVAASQVVATYLLPKIMYSFTQTYSDITVELQTRTDEEIERLVRMGSIDIGMTLQPPDDHFSFRVTPFAQERLIGIQPSLSFHSRNMIVPRDVVSIPITDTWDMEIMHLDSTETVKQFVMQGMGYGVILESAASLELSYGKLLPWATFTPIPVVASVITRPAERLSKSVWYFLNHLRIGENG